MDEWIYARRPRVYLDIELYRPRTRHGRAGFFSNKTRLVAASLGIEYSDTGREVKTWACMDEQAILDEINNALEKVLHGKRPRIVPLIGYNILALDIPFIVLRALQLNYGAAKSLQEKLLRKFIHIDLFQIALYAYHGDGLPSFKSFQDAVYLARGRNPPPKETGYLIHTLYERRECDKIIEYSRNEMNELINLYNLLVSGDNTSSKTLPREWLKLADIIK